MTWTVGQKWHHFFFTWEDVDAVLCRMLVCGGLLPWTRSVKTFWPILNPSKLRWQLLGMQERAALWEMQERATLWGCWWKEARKIESKFAQSFKMMPVVQCLDKALTSEGQSSSFSQASWLMWVQPKLLKLWEPPSPSVHQRVRVWLFDVNPRKVKQAAHGAGFLTAWKMAQSCVFISSLSPWSHKTKPWPHGLLLPHICPTSMITRSGCPDPGCLRFLMLLVFSPEVRLCLWFGVEALPPLWCWPPSVVSALICFLLRKALQRMAAYYSWSSRVEMVMLAVVRRVLVNKSTQMCFSSHSTQQCSSSSSPSVEPSWLHSWSQTQPCVVHLIGHLSSEWTPRM